MAKSTKSTSSKTRGSKKTPARSGRQRGAPRKSVAPAPPQKSQAKSAGAKLEETVGRAAGQPRRELGGFGRVASRDLARSRNPRRRPRRRGWSAARNRESSRRAWRRPGGRLESGREWRRPPSRPVPMLPATSRPQREIWLRPPQAPWRISRPKRAHDGAEQRGTQRGDGDRSESSRSGSADRANDLLLG